MNTLDTPVSGRFHDALAYASAMHATQARKGTQIAYISHVMAVCGIILEAGGTEDEAIAGVLHDGPEDQGGLERLADIRRRFGERVGEIVEHCSDTFETPKPNWSDRKKTYIRSLARADASTLLVSVADKLHNARATLLDLQNAPNPAAIWNRFSASPQDSLGNYRALLDAYRHGTQDPRRDSLVRQLTEIVDAMTRYV